ncbi:methyltransferase [Tumebacillus permanentifrigoris]|uniref:Methyltransferase family protein n=1 Tax=Tumebacillus permanentifrigoris TaxID=378543 RepID=A0A316DYR9_9BACL|nr:methyltransferase [Tumebacillus permanentifrigoris]PWK15650.1 methyltransferase family protein [Tumebacillus permanentifrigoris]
MKMITNKQVEPMQPVQMFNGYVGAHMAYALHQIGLFHIMGPQVSMTVPELAEQTKCDQPRLEGLLRTGSLLGYFEFQADGTVRMTAMGEELRRDLGYFVWSVGGYGKIFQELGQLATTSKAWGHLRDNGLVALGADMCNRNLMTDLLYEVLDGLEFTHIADLGCGNGGRLVQFCQRYPHIQGVGVDIAAAAIELAEANVVQHGLEDRLKMICTNALDTFQSDKYQDVMANVEILSCFMMFHDLYNIDSIRDTIFDRLRNAFPNLKYFLIADTVQMSREEEDAKLPIFNVGYELVHDFMEVQIPSKGDYERLFVASGLTIEKCIDFGTPNTYLYLLRV